MIILKSNVLSISKCSKSMPSEKKNTYLETFIFISLLVSCSCFTTDFMWFLVLAKNNTHLSVFSFEGETFSQFHSAEIKVLAGLPSCLSQLLAPLPHALPLPSSRLGVQIIDSLSALSSYHCLLILSVYNLLIRTV